MNREMDQDKKNDFCCLGYFLIVVSDLEVGFIKNNGVRIKSNRFSAEF